MAKNKLKVPALLLSIAFMSMLLAACGGNNSNNAGNNGASSPPPASTAPSASPAQSKMTDGLGHEVEVPANPQRIIASYLEDYLVALGVKPVAQWSVANGTQDYLKDSLQDLPTIPYDLPLEAVASFNPDLLIIGSTSTVEGGKYDQYAKIAPTFALGDEINNDWRKALLKIGEVLHKGDEAQKVLDDYEKKAADAKEKLQAAIPGKSVAALWLVGGKFFVVSDKMSSGSLLYKDLGLKAPEVVKEISASGTGNWNAVSLEKLADLDADYIVLVNSDQDSGSSALEDALWKSVPAVKNGNVFQYPRTSSWLYYGPVASTQMIDNLLKDIIK